MMGLFQIAAELQSLFNQNEWSFCFIGGLALQRWGEPRLTVDVDVTLLTGFGSEDRFVDAVLDRYAARRADAREFALASRVLLVQSAEGVGIDIALGGLPFEERMAERSSHFQFTEKVSLRTCSAEDLIVMKAFAARERDWLDLQGIVIRQGGTLNWDLISAELNPLCDLKEAPEIMDRLEDIRRRFQ